MDQNETEVIESSGGNTVESIGKGALDEIVNICTYMKKYDCCFIGNKKKCDKCVTSPYMCNECSLGYCVDVVSRMICVDVFFREMLNVFLKSVISSIVPVVTVNNIKEYIIDTLELFDGSVYGTYLEDEKWCYYDGKDEGKLLSILNSCYCENYDDCDGCCVCDKHIMSANDFMMLNTLNKINKHDYDTHVYIGLLKMLFDKYCSYYDVSIKKLHHRHYDVEIVCIVFADKNNISE